MGYILLMIWQSFLDACSESPPKCGGPIDAETLAAWAKLLALAADEEGEEGRLIAIVLEVMPEEVATEIRKLAQQSDGRPECVIGALSERSEPEPPLRNLVPYPPSR